ncbi:MAG: NADH-quinone oxidoreductase subunit C, partial [Thermoprotei archaeon]
MTANPQSVKKAQQPPVDKLALEKQIASELKLRFGPALVTVTAHSQRRIRAECTPDSTVSILSYAKNDLGFDHMNYITAVDRRNKFELVYNVWSIAKRVELHLKTSIPHSDKDEFVDFPSCVTVYSAADWLEREVYDLFGVNFLGHPDMRRILLREDWGSHPLRKIYDRRGNPLNPATESKHPPDTWRSNEGKIALPARWLREDPEIEESVLTLNFGPHHPSTHGPMMIRLRLDGEIVVDADVVIGYLHRNHEKLGENNTWVQMLPYPDRTNYVSPINWEWAYVRAVEELVGIEPTERAEYIRVIMAELDRIQSHLMFLATAGDEVGQLTGFVWG